jgi:SAM-dependent methyltransferase
VPVDRFYVARFLERRRRDIRGRVLEIGGGGWARAAGRSATRVDVRDVSHIPVESYDCVICAQALGTVDDVRTTVAAFHRVLAPGGTLLIAAAGCNGTPPASDELWRLTRSSLRRLLEDTFPSAAVTVTSCGTRASALALLHGHAVDTLTDDELDAPGEPMEVVLLGRAVKRAPANGGHRG